MPFFLYILHSQKIDRYYIGVSADVESRLQAHNSASKGWTTRGRPWHLVFKRQFAEKMTAQKWERWLKNQKSRKLLLEVIDNKFDWETHG